MKVPLPPDEDQRLQALHEYAILDTEPEAAFERIARLAARRFDVPIAFISLIDSDRQWLKSCYGMASMETERDTAFCAHAILSEQVMVVSDATRDERFAKNPFVVGEPHFRFYAGAPLISPEGHNVGALAIMDTAPRQFSGDDQTALADLAALVMDTIQLRRAALAMSADIAERQRTEAELRFQAHIVNSVQQAVIVTDLDGTITSWNRYAETLYGWPAADVIGRNIIDVTVPIPMRDEAVEIMERLSVGGFRSAEFLVQRRDGTTFPAMVTTSPLLNTYGARVGILGISEDISERKRSEEAMQERTRLATLSAEVGRSLTENQPLKDQLQGCAEALVRSLGVAVARIWTLNKADEVLELQASAGMSAHLDDSDTSGPAPQVKIGPMVNERRPYVTNNVIGDPQVRNHEWAKREGMASFAGYPLILEDQVVGVIALFAQQPVSASVVDAISTVADQVAVGIERKRTEAALQESEERLQAILDNSPGLIYVKDTEGRFILVNRRFTTLFGIELARIIGKSDYDLFPEAVAQSFRAQDLQILSSRNSLELEDHFPFNDQLHYFLTCKFPLFNIDGEPYAVCGVSTDITEIKCAEVALLQSKEAAEHSERAMQRSYTLLQTIIEGTEDIIFLKDPQSRYQILNSAGRRFFGVTLDELIGKVELPTVSPDINAAMVETDQLVLSNSHPLTYELEINMRDSRHTWLVTKFAYRDHEGDLAGIVGIVHDITQRKLNEVSLREARDEADRANRAKSDFLSRMSHELRTPMNSILGFTELLLMDPRPPRDTRNLQHILKAGQHLLELINEVLDITRVETGQVSFSIEPILVSDVLREALDLVRPLAANRNVRLHEPDLCDHHILADRQRLKQVVLNLLANAIKYNSEGGSVFPGCEITSPERLRISVSDTGEGIPAEKLDRLFIPFDRLGAEQSSVEGTGIGLALSKRLVEAMGGAIGVDSIVRQGSTFWVEFTRAADPTESLEHTAIRNLPNPNQSEVSAPHRTHTILYIEDNLVNLKLIEGIIARQPWIKLLAGMQGSVGLDLARQHHPDLILLDIHLPDMDGEEIFRRLQEEDTTRDIPVVVLSADATASRIERLLAAGVRAYLTKPLQVARFLEVLNEVLNRE